MRRKKTGRNGSQPPAASTGRNGVSHSAGNTRQPEGLAIFRRKCGAAHGPAATGQKEDSWAERSAKRELDLFAISSWRLIGNGDGDQPGIEGVIRPAQRI